MVPSFAVLAALPLAAGFRSQLQHTNIESSENNSTWPSSRAELPACPCTIYSGFCSRWDLGRGGSAWGAACVASADALVTMHWMVQCVPAWKQHLTYPCPDHLSVKCDAERTQDPCDTSALGKCEADTCHAGSKPKSAHFTPVFCQLGACTQTECCEACPVGASLSGDQCMGADGALPHTCCEEPHPGSEWDNQPTCDDQILSLSEPTAMRMQAYSQTCRFDTSDVDMSASKFALTTAGQRKLCEAPCQSSPDLMAAPMDIWGDAQSLAGRCENQALTSQISAVGFFAAAGEMDSVWRRCASGVVPADDGDDGFISKGPE